MKALKNKGFKLICILLAAAALIIVFNNNLYNNRVINDLSRNFRALINTEEKPGKPLTPVTEDEEPAGDDNKGEERIAYLTFDDGPSENTVKVLDVLKEYEVKGTFFVNGKDTPFARYVYKRIVKEGHALGNHTYSHTYRQIYKSVDSFFADMLKLEELLDEVAGVRPRIMRFPGGSTNTISRSVSGRDIMKELIQAVTEAGYMYTDWNVCAFDAYKPPPSEATIAANVLHQSKDKDVVCVLFHDSDFNHTTPGALPQIIEGLREMGFLFEVITPDTEPIWFY